jgi:hypothetical protein
MIHKNSIMYPDILYFNKLSKLRAQKRPKIVAPSPLSSDIAGSSVAVSNENYGTDFYLSDPEVSEESGLFRVSAYFFSTCIR